MKDDKKIYSREKRLSDSTVVNTQVYQSSNSKFVSNKRMLRSLQRTSVDTAN